MNLRPIYVHHKIPGRSANYQALAEGPFQAWGVSQYVIRGALRRRGYAHYVTRIKMLLLAELTGTPRMDRNLHQLVVSAVVEDPLK